VKSPPNLRPLPLLPRSRNCCRVLHQVETVLKLERIKISSKYNAGKTKYSIADDNPKICEILGESTPHQGLMKVAYAEASWKNINSALNTYKRYCDCKRIIFKLPIDSVTMSNFVSWDALEKKLSPDPIKLYISNIKLVHKLKGLPTDGCNSFLCKTLIRGVENLHFYSKEKKEQKKAMSLPLLRILGHELAKSNWADHSKLSYGPHIPWPLWGLLDWVNY
jgi:hypothetical protein